MKISCDIIIDLLPLYHDNVCNESSKKLVEEHIAGCDACRTMLEKIRDNTLDNRIKQEREDVVRHHTQAVKRKSLVVGICIASVLAIPVLVSLIVNLATGHALDWFFIVLTSLMLLASVTVVPLIVDRNRGLWTLGSFIGSLALLLITISLYSGWSNWPFVAIASTLLGLSIPFAPYVISKLPLTGVITHHKGLLAMAINTLLLYMLLIVIGLVAQSSADYWRLAFLIASTWVLFPWSLFLVIRYARTGVLIKIGLCFVISGLYSSIGGNVTEWIVTGIWRSPFAGANLSAWELGTINGNISLLLLLTGCIVGGALVVIGLLQKKE